MSKPILHFSHANGFPGSCYRELFKYLEPTFRVDFMDTIGHDPHYPVTDSWNYLVDELINTIRTHYQEPVFGVGHSLGGVLTYLAAVREPDLFHAIVLLDAPVLGFGRSFVLWLAKRLGFIDRLLPAARTKVRKNAWKTLADARTHFQKKELFSHFDPQCFDDYLNYGLVPAKNGGVKLKFKPYTEYQIYRSFPHQLPLLRKALVVPAGLLWGSDSKLVTADTRKKMQVKLKFNCTAVQGGHLFPLEHPVLTAQALCEMWNDLMK